jgi:ribonuclease D
MDIIALFYYSNVLELIQVSKRKHFPTGIKPLQDLMQKPNCKKLNFTSQNMLGILNVSPGYVLNL